MAKRKTAPKKIVTKDSLQLLLDNPNKEFVRRVVGKALVHLYDRQTVEEKRADDTLENNGIGFNGGDGRRGTQHAKWYKTRSHLDDWAVAMWATKNENGYSRLSKYHKQLNEVAVKEAVRKAKTELKAFQEEHHV